MYFDNKVRSTWTFYPENLQHKPTCIYYLTKDEERQILRNIR